MQLRVIFPAIILAFMFACTPAGAPGLKPAPDLAFPNVAGGELKISDYRGKVIYVDFWATWCGPCIKAIPELNHLHEKYKDRGFAVLGISVDDLSAEAIGHFAKNENMLYPVAMGSTEDMALFGPSPGLPTGYLVNARGEIVNRFIGQLPIEKLEAAVVAALDAETSGKSDEGAH